MNDYKNLSGRSNVLSFQLGDDFIVIKFKTAGKDGCDTYKYSYLSTGSSNVEDMKNLAIAGSGLNSFINTHVKKQYESRWYE